MPADLSKPLPTTARLSLGRTAPSVATTDHLHFQLDHALARDAVHTQLDTALLIQGLESRNLEPLLLRSAIDSTSQTQARRTYLRRPDLGRKLHPDSIAALQESVILSEVPRNVSPRGAQSKDPESVHPTPAAQNLLVNDVPGLPHPRILFLLADGLSALALERHALPLLDATLPLLPTHYSLIPILTNARVALADEIGSLLHAGLTILLIGERPGLSSPDSLGVYITWNPQPRITTDADRNCISNIRGSQGLGYAEAGHRIAHYIAEATRLQTTGTVLKDPIHNPLI